MGAKIPIMDVDPYSGKVEKAHWFPAVVKWAIVVCIMSLFGMVAVNRFTENNLTTTRKTPALATATAIETAVNNFFTEYGKLPNVGSKVTTDSPDGIQLLHILLGIEPAGENPQNTRHVKFLSVKEGKEKRDGLIYAADGRSVEGLYDSWGNPYTVEIDTDFNEILEFKRGGISETLKGRRFAVHSPGPDRKHGTADDVTTW